MRRPRAAIVARCDRRVVCCPPRAIARRRVVVCRDRLVVSRVPRVTVARRAGLVVSVLPRVIARRRVVVRRVAWSVAER